MPSAGASETFVSLLQGVLLVIDVDDPQLFDVFGGCVRFLASPEDTGSDYGFLQGVLPPGVVVPLHKHNDPESFHVIEGEMQVFYDDGKEAGWKTVRTGELAVIPGNVKHAWWNRSDARCLAMIVTGPDLYAFFQEIAIPAPENWTPGLPNSERIAAVTEAASGHQSLWMATPEENEAIGLPMPPKP